MNKTNFSIKALFMLLMVGVTYYSRVEMLREICKVAPFLTDSQVEALTTMASFDIVGLINAIITLFKG